MKRAVLLALTGALVMASLAAPASAAKKKKKSAPPKKVERTATSDYQAPAFGFPEATWVCLRPTNSCGDIPVGAEEAWVKVEIADSSGTATAFVVGQDTDPNTVGTDTEYGVFCGSTGDQPIGIQPGAPLVVAPYIFGGAVCAGGVGTSGTITATLSNLP